jgi:hypothetical protein
VSLIIKYIVGGRFLAIFNKVRGAWIGQKSIWLNRILYLSPLALTGHI